MGGWLVVKGMGVGRGIRDEMCVSVCENGQVKWTMGN